MGAVARNCGYAAYLVGGPVRDAFLGRSIIDVDVSVEGDAISLAERIAERHNAIVDKTHGAFGTATITFDDGSVVDLATARAETYSEPAALPTVTPASIREDLVRRDFTINAMAAPIERDGFGALVDPHGGIADLHARKIRVLHPGSFQDDPTRVFRAYRFAWRFGFALDEATFAAAREAASGGVVAQLTGARVRNEIAAVLREDEAISVLSDLHACGVLPKLATPFPFDADAESFVGRADAFVTASRAERPRTLLLAWLDALGAEVGTLVGWLLLTAEVARDLGAISAVTDALAGRGPRTLRPSEWYPLLAGACADVLSSIGARYGAPVHAEALAQWLRFADLRPLVTGDDLLELGYEPGPKYRPVLQAVLDAQLDGELTDRVEALTLAQERMRVHDPR